MPSLRITGTETECYKIADELRKVFVIRDVSRFYPNRGSKLGRVYVEI